MSEEKKLYSLREAAAYTLIEIAKSNKKVVVLDADVSKSTMTVLFKKVFNDRFFNFGVAEQDMMSTAAGLATCGLIPVVSSFAIFVIGRAFEQLRNSVCYPDLNVKILATHAGITVGEDGASHQSIEDIAITRVLPNMTVLVPSDIIDLNILLTEAIKLNGPVYIRIPRISLPIIHKKDFKIKIGEIEVIKDGKDLTIITNGVMLHRVLKVIEMLEDENISVALLNMCSVKPIDKEKLLLYAKKTGKIMVVEEHSVIGGTGSAVSEFLSQHYPIPIKFIGIPDKFGQSGKADELLDNYNLSIDNIFKEAISFINV
ncbi:MAG TPA: transketolase family protein [bacterium]|nr:transketolase family protein [bacterium]HOL47642.1 transketolase family protein [bacterium]HPQ19646.1 transketolase family protein [bacterium]